LFATRTRSSLNQITSTKQNLKFSQLLIYYSQAQKTLNKQFAYNLELLTPDDKYNYNAYLLSDINTSSFKLASYKANNRSEIIVNEDFENTCIVTAAKKVLDRLDIENKTFSTINGDRIDKRLWNNETLGEYSFLIMWIQTFILLM